MAIGITDRLSSLKDQIAKTPQLILEIEGLDTTFSSTIVFDLTRWDNPIITWDDGVTTWDGLSALEGNSPLIDLRGSQRSLTQQIRPDKSSTQSVPTFNISIVDKNNVVAQQFSFDNLEEQLGKKCNVYLNLQGGIHPQDSIPILFGFIDEFTFRAGTVKLSVSHASNLQRQGIYNQATTDLTSTIDDSVTTIPVVSTAGFIEASDAQKSFLQIEDEIMQVISSSPTSFEVIRGQLGTIAVSHEITEVLSYYTLTGKPIDLALKLLLSDSDNSFRDIGFDLDSIEFVSVTESIDNALIFDSVDVEALAGIVAGDTLRVTGSASNDGDYTARSFGTLEDGRSFIEVEENLTSESATAGSVEYRSKYNVLNEGLGLENREVDVEGLELIAVNFDSEFFIYEDLPIKEGIDNAKDFIEQELYFPQNLYSIPRKARISGKYTVPPLSIDITPTLNATNVKNIQNLDVKRTIHKYYYNAIQYRYNKDYLQDKFFRTASFLSGESSRIRTGNSILTIPSDGLREGAGLETALERLSGRLLARYRLAALEIRGLEVLFKDSLNLEVGDIIPFGGANTQLPDPQTGKRTLPVKLYEIINKALDVQSGKVKLDLIETGFGLEGVRAVIAPSSETDGRSTASEIIVTPILDTGEFNYERQKYEQYLGAAVRVRAADYTLDESSIIVGFSDANQNGIIIDPPLSAAPPAGSVFELDIYANEPDNEAGDLVKLKFCHFMEQSTVTVAGGSQNFDVDDLTGLFIGQKVTVHSKDFTDDSFSDIGEIDNIVGNTITLVEALNFTPSIGDKLETYSFEDGNDGYVIL